MKILIVKTSSLGDIIQCFPVLNYLHQLFPNIQVDWVVEEPFLKFIESHPQVHRAIPKRLSEIRKEIYDFVFDLQGNCKSGWVTFLAKSKKKIGFDFASVREWPNIIATNRRYFVPKNINIRLQYLSLFEQFFKKKMDISQVTYLKSEEKLLPYQNYVMVCPGSKWINKQLREETLLEFLSLLHTEFGMRFLFVWGDLHEKEVCERLQLPASEVLPTRLEIPLWQQLMSEMELVIAVDSSALHLCGTTKTPSFSIFGPTTANVFKPIGNQHHAIQGKCPYHQSFEKQCPILRTCPSGACIRDIKPQELFDQFSSWYKQLKAQDP